MILPAPLAAALAAADEDYLVGLSNKGTVNRARKDLAGGSEPTAVVEGEEAAVRFGEVCCRIRAPLGESLCSCPSASICRHRIAAILWLQRQAATLPHPGEEAPAAAPERPGLRGYPPEKLARQLGVRRLEAVLARHSGGEGPAITESSVVTVELPWLPATVRLLEPLEHSSCSCHSRDFCLHKAEALLFWQLSRGVADPDALRAACPAEDGPDPGAVREVCRAVREALASQMATGLSRLPPDTGETVERLAALAHTAALPALERALRALQEEYAACFARSAAFRDEAYLSRFTRAFRLAGVLEGAKEESLHTLAGSFRENYASAGRLELYLLGLREVAGRSGYAGTVYYFWETASRRFYTFSDLRPTFYEKQPRRRPSASPWGLPVSLRQAWNCALVLNGARANDAGGLSATGQCTATLLGPRKPGEVFPEEEVCADFSRLLAERSAPRAPEIERLALVRPARCEPQEYDRVRQTFSLRLLDAAGRDLWVEVRYKKEERQVVAMLERLAGRLTQCPDLRPVFFGTMHRDGDRLALYPIEFFPDWEAQP